MGLAHRFVLSARHVFCVEICLNMIVSNSFVVLVLISLVSNEFFRIILLFMSIDLIDVAAL